MTETSLCSLRNFHWVRWWVVFPNYLQTTSMPWLEGCQATSGADCSWRHTAQGDRVLRGRWGRIGGILTPRAKPRELFMLSDKFLLAHSWGTVSGITRFDCHMSIIAGWLARLFPPLFSFLSEWHYGGEKSTFCSLSWTSNFDWHTDCRTHPQHPVIAPLPGCMEHNQSWWWCRFGSSEWANENPLCHLIKLEETLRALVFNFSWPGLSLRVVYVRKNLACMSENQMLGQERPIFCHTL